MVADGCDVSRRASKPDVSRASESLRILYYGVLRGNSGSRFNGLKAPGHTVEAVFRGSKHLIEEVWKPLRALEWRVCNGPTTWRINRMFLRKAREFRPEVVWVEKGRLVYPSTLRRIRDATGALLVNSHPDNFMEPHQRSRHYDRCIPLFDAIFTPREAHFQAYRERGARHVGKYWKGYAPELHFPEELTEEEEKKYRADVVFVGHHEENRGPTLSALCRAVPNMKIYGRFWRRCPRGLFPPGVVQYRQAPGHEYRKVLCGSKIAVQILSRWACDTQTSRSFEIPACGVMMLAERNGDHLACFEEDTEAVFFSTDEELVDKAKFYLAHEELRRRIAQAGRRRCVESGYSNHERVRAMLEEALATPAGRALGLAPQGG